MKIKVRLSDAGLRDAERQIQEYKTTLNKKAQEFAKALAQKGIDVATVRFANAQYAGDNDVTVEHDPVQTPKAGSFDCNSCCRSIVSIQFCKRLRI